MGAWDCRENIGSAVLAAIVGGCVGNFAGLWLACFFYMAWTWRFYVLGALVLAACVSLFS